MFEVKVGLGTREQWEEEQEEDKGELSVCAHGRKWVLVWISGLLDEEEGMVRDEGGEIQASAVSCTQTPHTSTGQEVTSECFLVLG